MTAGLRRADVYLSPGELVVRQGAGLIRTIVGSCVAVCLWDARARLGGMNHYLLPRPGRDDQPGPRFGSIAIPQLIERTLAAGAARADLVAAVIGGGAPVSTIQVGAVGASNTAIALLLLAEHDVPIVRQETGGAHGRRLMFDTATGKLVVEHVRGFAEAAAGGPAP